VRLRETQRETPSEMSPVHLSPVPQVSERQNSSQSDWRVVFEEQLSEPAALVAAPAGLKLSEEVLLRYVGRAASPERR